MDGNLVDELVNLNEHNALRITQRRVDAGEDLMDILADTRKALQIVGKRFAEGHYYIPDLIYSGEIMKEITAIVKPRLTEEITRKHLGQVVLGTVAGDIHDIGLNIVEFMLDINGFEVHNLGVDVPESKFVESIKETGSPVVGLSGFLTSAFDVMKTTIEAIENAGLRDKTKIMIGGGQVDEKIMKYTGADAFGIDAADAVTISKKWICDK